MNDQERFEVEDFVRLKSSVERLRAQRQQIQEMQAACVRKDAQISALKSEISDLRDLLRRNSVKESERDALRQQVTSLQTRCSQLEHDVHKRSSDYSSAVATQSVLEESFRVSVSRTEKRMHTMRADHEAEIRRLQAELDVATASAREHQGRAASTEQQVVESSEQLARAQDIELRLRRDQVDLLQRVAALEAKNAELVSQGEREKQVMDELRGRNRQLEQANQDLERGLAAVRKDMYRAQDEELTARSHLHRVEGSLKSDLSDAQARLAELNTELRIKNDLIKDQKSMLDRSGSALRQAEAGVDELRRSLRELELHNKRLGTDLEAAERVQQETQRDHEQLHSRYEELCDAHGELKARAKHLTRELEAERGERQRWARARLELLSEIDQEEVHIQSAIDDTFGDMGHRTGGGTQRARGSGYMGDGRGVGSGHSSQRQSPGGLGRSGGLSQILSPASTQRVARSVSPIHRG